jgi:hypothetical protein
MGSQNCGIVGKSQPVLIMANPIIFTHTRRNDKLNKLTIELAQARARAAEAEETMAEGGASASATTRWMAREEELRSEHALTLARVRAEATASSGDAGDVGARVRDAVVEARREVESKWSQKLEDTRRSVRCYCCAVPAICQPRRLSKAAARCRCARRWRRSKPRRSGSRRSWPLRRRSRSSRLCAHRCQKSWPA